MNVIVDTSVNQVPRVWQSEWYYHILAANKADAAPVETVCVGGPLQSWNDYLGLDRKLPKVERGDLIALLDVGSYAESCDSQYCSYPRPASILVSKDHVVLVPQDCSKRF